MKSSASFSSTETSAVIDRKWAETLACPKCANQLQQRTEKLDCLKCQRSWPVVHGIPYFVEDFPYWGEIPHREMQEVNRLAETGSWKAALLDSSEPSVQRAAVMILNLERANWQWLLDLPPDSRVLDLGAGMGANSHALAMYYREVVALEPVLERVQFMRQRFAQEKLSNIKILRSSVWVLPLEKASFDLVALNGVLEWVAEGGQEDPGQMQMSALKQVYSLLRPGGYVYLGIENRFAFGNFAGYPDAHCGLPFVTVVPRTLANWYARRRGHREGYRNYLYSSRGYRKLLQSVGFSQLEIYVALPSYNHPRFLIPLRSNIFSYYSRNFYPPSRRGLRRTIHKILLKFGLLHHLEYSFVILARK
jgi:SAM-dependent methyltransferase